MPVVSLYIYTPGPRGKISYFFFYGIGFHSGNLRNLFYFRANHIINTYNLAQRSLYEFKKKLGLVYSVKEPKKVGNTVVCCILMSIQLSLIWPIYPLVGSIEPIVFGMPFSIAWVLLCLLLSFFDFWPFYMENQKSERTDYKILRKACHEHQNLRPTSRVRTHE